MNVLSFIMLASLFFKAGGTGTDFDTQKVKLNEGIKLELPCVQTAVFFAQTIDSSDNQAENGSSAENSSSGDSSDDDYAGDGSENDDSSISDFAGINVSGGFVPLNWGIRVYTDKKATSVSPPSSLRCEFSVGRISVSGPLSELKQPVPAFRKRWNVRQPSDVKVKGGLPDISAGKKPLSVCVSLDTGVFFAGFAAVALEQSATSEFSAPAGSSCNTDSLGADILLAQLGFFPEELFGFHFYTSCTFSASMLDGTENSRWFSVNEFRPADTAFSLLNDTVLSKSWDALSVSIQNSFAAGISRHKSGAECWNNTLLCLSCSKLSVSLGFWCSDFGFTTSSGSDIRTPIRLYGSVAFSFSAVGAKFDIYASCMTGTSYEEGFSAEKRVETSARTGVSADFSDFSVSADGAVKDLCREDAYAKATLETSVEIGFAGGSLRWNGETPLVLLPSEDSAFKWDVTLKPAADWMGGVSGSVSGKFCGMEFSAFECNISFSASLLKISAGVNVSASKKLTWSLSAQVKL